MKWRLKVACFKALSGLPGGTALYRFSQKHLTGSLRPTEARVSQKIVVGMQYFDWLEKNGHSGVLIDGSHLDFGAGWHPTIPLLFYSLGVRQQYLFDLSPLLDQELIEQTVEIFLTLLRDPQWARRIQPRRLPPNVAGKVWQSYLSDLGILYQSPYNGAWASVKGKMDLATSTQVLLHIPRSVLADCFAQIHTCLKPGGLFLATIHLRDLVASVQPGASKYNQLRYSNETWETWVNSSLMSYNRLRAPDYKELLEKAGFKVIGYDIEHGTAEDLAELERIPVASCFQRYSREDLAAKHLFFAAQKQ